MTVRLLALSLVLFSVHFVTQAEGAVEKTDMVMCRSQKTVRTIRVTGGGDGCQTVYTKAGVDRVVGNAKSKQSCLDVMRNIRGNLEGAAWRCREVSAATYTDVKN